MKRVNSYIYSFYCFLQLFGFHIRESKDELRTKLIKSEKLDIYDKDDSLVGYVDYVENNLKVNIALMEGTISADISCSNKSFIKYSIKTPDDKKLDGLLLITYYFPDEISIFNNILVYDGDAFLGKCIVSTSNNKFYVYDALTNSKVSYKNGRFSYTSLDKYARVSYEDGLIIYVMNNLKSNHDSICGGFEPKDANHAGLEFISMINTLVPEYKNTLDSVRGYINDVNPELFLSAATLSLNDKTDYSIKTVLDIDDSDKFSKGRTLRKKN